LSNKKKNKKRPKGNSNSGKSKATPSVSRLWLLLLLLIPVLGLLYYLTAVPEKAHPEPDRPADIPRAEKVEPEKVVPEEAIPETKPPAPVRAEPDDLPLVAFVIDDIGINMNYFNDLLSINKPMTLSVLPGRPFTEESVQRARAEGLEVLLHLPMEPDDYPFANPGDGAIFSFMSDRQVEETVENGLRSVPGAVGVNNHMGSRITSNTRIMKTVFHVLKRHRLFFIDSRTTAETVACETARDMGLRADSRSVFLDDERNEAVISAQLKLLVRKAKDQGYAIGIGHKNRATVNVLKEMLPAIETMGVRPVFCSQLPSLSPHP
jgi:polysaccharide deacetylase 2 family uncharacterized protein YibQ